MKKHRSETPNTKVSKALTYLLRHGGEKEGLSIGSDGFVDVEEILNHNNIKSKKVNFAKIEEIVKNCQKQRFELQQREVVKGAEQGKGWVIRATQGHTIKTIDDSELLDKIVDPEPYKTLVHGTYFKFWDSIKKQGLKAMSRNHMHFAPNYPGEKEVISGMRSSCDICIEIDMRPLMKEGVEFFLSKNNVVLTSGINGVIPPKFFTGAYEVRNWKVDFTKDLRGKDTIITNIEKVGARAKVSEHKMEIEEEEKKINNEDNEDFDYLLILDFEAQCEDEQKLEIKEIIEFPVVPIHIKEKQPVENVFHHYVKPEKMPLLTEFCKNLTGIKQEWVDGGVGLEKTIEKLDTFLKKSDICEKRWIFVTCGDWDLRTCLHSESKKKKINVPKYLRSYINLKDVFKYFFKYEGGIAMTTMLEHLGLNLEGRHHSGIDDCKNLGRIVVEMIKRGCKFGKNFVRNV